MLAIYLHLKKSHCTMILGINLFVTLFFLFLVSITYHNLSLLKDFTQMYLGSFRFG